MTAGPRPEGGPSGGLPGVARAVRDLRRVAVSRLGDERSVFHRENLVAALGMAFFVASCSALVRVDVDFRHLLFADRAAGWDWWLTFLVLPPAVLGLARLFRSPRLVAWSLYGSAVSLTTVLATKLPQDLPFLAGLSILLVAVCVWVCKREDAFFKRVWLHRHNGYVAVLLFLLFSGAVSSGAVLRYHLFGAGGFDLGIFAQMFEHMNNLGVPLNTYERNELVSHFDTHVSPFFYLLLPGYRIWPHPVYLLVVQAVAVGSGVFAILGITRRLGFSPAASLPCLLLYTLYPTLSYGCLNDFHEHKFLAPCLLWVLYFVLSGDNRGLFLSAAVTLSLKEDTPVFLCAIALYMILARGEVRRGLVLAGGSLVWFVGALALLQYLGHGLMTHRYSNFIEPGQGGAQGLWAIIRVSFFDLGYTLREATGEGRPQFLLWTFLPVLFAPFFNRQVSNWVLLIPMLLVNLITSWPAQYDIFSQHVFGSAALIVYLTVLTGGQLRGSMRRLVLIAAPALCLAFTAALFGVHLWGGIASFYETRAANSGIDAFLQRTIPLEATVTCANNLTPHLYRYGLVYNMTFDAPTDYFVLDTREDNTRVRARLTRYERVASHGFCEIYRLALPPRRQAAPTPAP